MPTAKHVDLRLWVDLDCHENIDDLDSLVPAVCALLAIGHPGVGFVSVGLADFVAAASAGNHCERGVRLAWRAAVLARAIDSLLRQASGVTILTNHVLWLVRQESPHIFNRNAHES